jgi:putative transposase
MFFREIAPRAATTRYLVRDRDRVYGHHFIARVEGLGVDDVPISPRSPWQNCYAERVIGSIRRECLDHLVVINKRHLRRILKSYFQYYHRSRTHLALQKDAPQLRPVRHRSWGRIVQIREVGGLHHRYDRVAA